MEINEITRDILDASIEVHKTLGPGLLERVYELALKKELELREHKVDSQIPIEITYKGTILSKELRLDLLVDDTIIIELKSVEELKNVHFKQLQTYLKLTNLRIGILINFNVTLLKDGFHRIAN